MKMNQIHWSLLNCLIHVGALLDTLQLQSMTPWRSERFGYVTGMTADEFGYVSLIEIESVKGPLGIGIEQDLNFQQKRLSEVK